MPRYSRRRRAEPLHIYTDGCALRNGQPGAKGGWAIVYELGDFQDDYGYCTDDPQTNNRFELEAIGQALERSVEFEYVEAHSGNWFNEKADRLAKKAAFMNPLYSNYDYNYRC
ncbi:hypothetical protein CAEBREN_09117 [Caenorhabditis brenneri]|uniref:ribonuclease H n=1 Tax=Caenorhabditis brenneri TaxID=135651 RepID=G0MPV9_CAEBE|nr:hypothetical protein CAEBREN_09117 [Caenorhabditis brenneri]